MQQSTQGGLSMAECELCGAMKVGVKEIKVKNVFVLACSRCQEKHAPSNSKQAPGIAMANQRSFNLPKKPSANYKGKANKNILRKQEKELSPDFKTRIIAARKSQGLSQEELARKMAEKINVIKSIESGRRPTDSVIRKLEKTLGIELMVAMEHQGESRVASGNSRGMTFGDYFNNLG